MWHLLHLIARPIEALLGVFCIVTAIMLYPGEEGKIQSKFEDFWIRVDDFKNLALTRHTAFMTGVAKLETRFLDRVFGDELISGRVIGVSFSCSAAVVSLLFLFSAHDNFYHAVGEAILLVGSIALGVRCIFFGGFSLNTIIRGIVLLLVLPWICFPNFAGFIETSTLVPVIVTVPALICDIAFVALTRRLLRLAGEMTRSSRVMLVVFSNLLLALCLLSPLFAAPFEAVEGFVGDFAALLSNPFLVLVAVTNVFDAALAFLFELLLALLLVHRLLWPFLTRTLFQSPSHRHQRPSSDSYRCRSRAAECIGVRRQVSGVAQGPDEDCRRLSMQLRVRVICSSLFAHFLWILVLTQRNKFRMTQPIALSPF
jgi:hypothetical protein